MIREPILIVALGEDSSLEVQRQLNLEPLEAPSVSLWISHGPARRTLTTLRGYLQRGTVRSAALLPEIPSLDYLWLVTEWRGKLIVDEDLGSILEEQEGWEIESRNERYHLMILSPGRAQERDRRSDVQVVEGPEEYKHALFSETPVVVRLKFERLGDDPGVWRQWFGELAEPNVGGSVALLALSGARPGSSEVLLRNPAALGLKVALDDASSLSTYCRQEELVVVAHGGSWGAHRYNTDDPQKEQVHQELLHAEREWHRRTNYYVLLEVEANVDPEVVIPAGAIFEQARPNGVQTLTAASPRKFQIDVGQFLPVALPAWCLNRNLSSPAGEPVRPTPLIYPSGLSDQGRVWDDIRQRLEETSL